MKKQQIFYKLSPYTSEKIWGYEKWIVSTLKNQESTCQGQNTKDIIGNDYPLLIKIIQANDTLSVQVHPCDEYARKNENSFGKTECWYILDAEPNATLISGIKGDYNREAFAEAIKNNTLEEFLYQTPISKGDFIFIPAGTVHAIQGGLRILEIQQPSDVTYRLYDWGRGRELHIEKSLDVIKPFISEPIRNFNQTFECDYFKVQKIIVETELNESSKNKNGDYTSFFVLDGEGSFEKNDEIISVKKEDTILVKNNEDFIIKGNLELFKMES